MSLVNLYERGELRGKTIQQIVSFAGEDGVLKDNSTAQSELRDYFLSVQPDELKAHLEDCLENKFDSKGFVLQDLVNEIGRRINFEVENGRYRGVRNETGFDGIWKIQDYSFVIETKTTAHYAISLENVAKYRRELIQQEKVSEDSSVLFIVGNEDTLALEQQIRGSEFSWNMRILGLEALLKLMKIYVESSSDDVGRKIVDMLKPVEYTKIDSIVDIVFATSIDKENQEETIDEENLEETIDNNQSRLPHDTVKGKRELIVSCFSAYKKKSLIRRKVALFSDSDNSLKVAILVSKYYDSGTSDYWYTYHPATEKFLSGGKEAYIIYGCIDEDYAFAIPLQLMEQFKDSIITHFVGEDKKECWHIYFRKRDNSMFLYLSNTKEEIDINQYKIDLV